MDLKIHENLVVVVFMVFLFFLIWWHFTLKKKVIYALMSPNSSDCVYSKLDVPSAPWPWEIQDLWLWKKKYIKLLFMHHRRGFLSIPLNYIKHQFCLWVLICDWWCSLDTVFRLEGLKVFNRLFSGSSRFSRLSESSCTLCTKDDETGNYLSRFPNYTFLP